MLKGAPHGMASDEQGICIGSFGTVVAGIDGSYSGVIGVRFRVLAGLR